MDWLGDALNWLAPDVLSELLVRLGEAGLMLWVIKKT
jgi:hypothetical protein